MRGRTAIAAGCAVMMIAGAGGAAAVPAAAEPRTGQRAGPAGRPSVQQVTLLTGDRVTVTTRRGAAPHLSVAPGKGRERMRFRIERRDGHSRVLPSDAEPLILAKRLDPRLFDVTQLIAWRYDDARSKTLPLISEGLGSGSVRGARTLRSLRTLGLASMDLPKAQAPALWRDLAQGRTLGTGGRIWLDGKATLSLHQSVPQIGAPAAWQRGYDGKGTTVAVLDSGYDKNHPDIKDAVVQSRDFTPEGNIQDTLGHGTHVASTIAGSGTASQGKYKGVAPGAKLAVGKVVDWLGQGKESEILAGMEWAATEVKADVVNMSLGLPDQPGPGPLEDGVNRLTQQTGTLFVVSAGNEGPDASTLRTPASADAALTVGAVDKSDKLAGFSSRGPRLNDFAVKPDLTAPGVDIVAARAEGTGMGRPVNDQYTASDGTSMAAPHVAGAAAILAQKNPAMTGPQLKAVLLNAAKPATGLSPFQQGSGRVDVARAVTQTLWADTGNLSTLAPWPHPPGQADTRTITYTNSSAAAVTLAVKAQLQGAGGNPAPAGLVTLDRSSISVPARGTARLRVTFHGDVSPGTYGGVLTATSSIGNTAIRTVLGAHVDTERYKVRVDTIDRAGKPATVGDAVRFNNLATGEYIESRTSGGVAELRIPPGTYHVQGEITTPGDTPLPITIVTGTLVVDGDERLTFDARQAKHLNITVDEPDPQLRGSWISYTFKSGGEDFSYGYLNYSEHPSQVAGAMPYVLPARRAGLNFFHQSIWIKKDANPTPYAFHVAEHHPDGVPDDPAVAVTKAGMATIRSDYRAPNIALPWWSYTEIGPIIPGVHTATPQTNFTTPARTVEYLTPGYVWSRTLEYAYPAGPGGMVTFTPDRRFEKGDDLGEVWNGAAIGPSVGRPGAVASRNGDEVEYRPDDYFNDSTANHTSSAHAAVGTIVLAKDGQEVARTPYDRFSPLTATVPPEEATYTLSVSADRSEGFPEEATGTKVDTVWTFRSRRTAEKTPLPLLAARLAPRGLDSMNRAAAGGTTEIQVRVEGGGSLTTVESSFDDGKTWQDVPVRADGDQWIATVSDPASGFVSLRAKAQNQEGSTVTQTMIRAYAIIG